MNSYFSLTVFIFSTFLYACGTMTAPGTVMLSSNTSRTLQGQDNQTSQSSDNDNVSSNAAEVPIIISESDKHKNIEAGTTTSSAVDEKQKDQHTRILAAISTTEKNTAQNSSQSKLTTDAPKNTTSTTSSVVVPVASVNAVPLEQPSPPEKLVVVNISSSPAQPITVKKIPIPKGNTNSTVRAGIKTQAIEFDTKSREESIKYSLANRYYQSGKYQSTIDILETSKSNELKNTKNRDLLVLAYTAYARELVSKADLLEAQTILEKAILMQPTNKVIRRQLSDIKNVREADRLYKNAINAYNGGNKDKAFESFNRVLILNPSHKKAKKYYSEIKTIVVDAHHKKAMQYFRRQQLSQAIKEWDRLLKVDPSNDFARMYRSRAIELQKKFEKF